MMKKSKIIKSILIALIVFGLFYWFQIRPSRIFSRCDESAKISAIKFYKEENPWENEGRYLISNYEFKYKQCLRENGISK